MLRKKCFSSERRISRARRGRADPFLPNEEPAFLFLPAIFNIFSFVSYITGFVMIWDWLFVYLGLKFLRLQLWINLARKVAFVTGLKKMFIMFVICSVKGVLLQFMLIFFLA